MVDSSQAKSPLTAFLPITLLGRFGKRRYGAIGIAFICSGFAAIAANNLTLPGLYYDEVIQNVLSVAFVKRGLTDLTFGIPESVVHLGSHPLALMTMPYIGAVKTLAYIPFLFLLGPGVEGVRVLTISVGVVTLCLVYQALSRTGGRAIALIASTLLATNLAFITHVKVDFGPNVFAFMLAALSLLFLVRWWETRRTWLLFAASVTLGLATWNKVDFLWVIAGMALPAAVMLRSSLVCRVGLRGAGVAMLGYALGSLPLIAYNLKIPPPTYEALLGLSNSSNPPGGILTQIADRFAELNGLLDNAEPFSLVHLDAYTSIPLSSYALIAGAACLMVSYAFGRRQAHVQVGVFAVIGTATVLFATAITRGGQGPQHVILTFPWPQIVLGAAIWEFASLSSYVAELRHRFVRPLIAMAITAVFIVVNLQAYAKFQSGLTTTGGGLAFSDAIYPLEGYLSTNTACRTSLILDWGINTNLVVLSDGNLNTNELFWAFHDAATPAQSLSHQISQPGLCYVLHSPAATSFPATRERFMASATAGGLRLRLDRTFSSRDGVPIFEVYQAGTATLH